MRRLNLRLIDIYKQDEPTTVDVLLAAQSFNDVLDQLDYLGAIAKQDKTVAAPGRDGEAPDQAAARGDDEGAQQRASRRRT